MYNLSNSQSDRIGFDTMVKSYLLESNFNLKPARAIEYFPNIEEMVDDVDEAKARIFEIAKELLLEKLIEDIRECFMAFHKPIRVYDTGQDVFGEFESGVQAIDAIRTSRKSWWAMAEAPSFELVE